MMAVGKEKKFEPFKFVIDAKLLLKLMEEFRIVDEVIESDLLLF